MALTNEQLLSLGFQPSVRGRGGLSKTKKYDSLVFPLNDTDFLYTGYNPYKKQINFKTIWKSFKDSNGNRITYQVINLADTGFTEFKTYLDRNKNMEILKEDKLFKNKLNDLKEDVHSDMYKNNEVVLSNSDKLKFQKELEKEIEEKTSNDILPITNTIS